MIVSLPAFPENEKLCAHSTLLHYVARTANIRQSLNSSQVFVSYGKPYKVISSATLARWLKAVLSLAGIDTSIFKFQRSFDFEGNQFGSTLRCYFEGS